jgi:hypothetical protein
MPLANARCHSDKADGGQITSPGTAQKVSPDRAKIKVAPAEAARPQDAGWELFVKVLAPLSGPDDGFHAVRLAMLMGYAFARWEAAEAALSVTSRVLLDALVALEAAESDGRGAL